MKALVIVEPGRVEIRDIVKPTPDKGEVLLRVGVVGFCGSDKKTYLGENAMVVGPRIPGHEIGATIAEIGSGVPSRLKVGMNCTVLPYTECGRCSACEQKRINTCENNQTAGVQRDGAMCEYIAVPHGKIITSDKLTLSELALVEPLTVGFHAVDRGSVSKNGADKVLVMGVGAVGLGAIAGAKNRGNDVTAWIRSRDKVKIAEAMGASGIYIPTNDFPQSHYNVVIEATGAGEMISRALDAVQTAGRVVYVGYASGDVVLPNFSLLTKKEADVFGSRNATINDFNEVIQMMEAGRLPVEQLVSREVSLENAGDALKQWSEGGSAIRILVNVS